MSSHDLAINRTVRAEELARFAAEVLKPKRIALGLSQETVARRIGVDRSRVSRIERGLGSPQDALVTDLYCAVYGLNEDERAKWRQLLFGYEGTEELLARPNPTHIDDDPDWDTARRLTRQILTSAYDNMAELARTSGVQADRIRNLLTKGERLEAEDGLKLFSAIHPHMSPADRRQFLKVIGLPHLLDLSDIDLDLDSPADNLLEVFADYPTQIARARIDGHPYLAINMADHASNRLRWTLDRVSSSSYRNRLLEVLADVKFEKAYAQHVVLLPSEVLAATVPTYHDLIAIARVTNSARIMSMANVRLGSAYYIAENYTAAAYWYGEALEHLDSADLQLFTLRALSLVFAYQGDIWAFRPVEQQIRRLIEEGHVTTVNLICEAYEGLGRANGLLGNPSAPSDFEEAARFGRLEKTQPLQAIQLARSTLELMGLIDSDSSHFLETAGQRAMGLARVHGYDRYASTIAKLLNENFG